MTARHRSVFCAVTGWPLQPGRSGGEIRDFHLVKQLLVTSRVEFFALHQNPADGRQDPLRDGLDSLITADPGEPMARPYRRRPLARLARAMRRRGLPVAGMRYPLDTDEQIPSLRRLEGPIRAALAREPDFFFVSPQVNPAVLDLGLASRRTRFIMASYDVEAVRMRRFALSETGLRGIASRLEVRRAERFETRNLARFDGLIAVSVVDRDIFAREYSFPPERILVIENGVDPVHFAFQPRAPKGTPEVVFVGSLGYRANEQAAWRLVDEIMPRVRASHPGARLFLVGQRPAPALQARHDGASTFVTGTVPDVRPYLARATVACIPLTSGSGTKYKLLEALSAGVPVACTPLALEGLTLQAGEHVLVGESDAELAAAVGRLVDDSDLADGMARRARAEVEARYAWARNLPRLDGWLDELSKLPKRNL